MAKSILICDDAAFMRMMIKDILVKNGYNIAGEAENGLKAIDKYMETKPDLVMMDITMPEMDGIETTKQIRKLDDLKIAELPIIALTAGVSKEERENCFKAGMNDFLSKPINKNELFEIIEKYLKH